MSKIVTVARAEYIKAVGSKAFIIGIILMPILFGGGAIAMVVAKRTTDVDDRSFAVWDRTGALYPAIEAAARERNETDIFERGSDESAGGDAAPRQVKPRWLPQRYEPAGDGAADELALSEQVKSKQLFGFAILGADIIAAQPAGPRSDETQGDTLLAWHTQTPSYDDLPDWLEGVINREIKQRRFAEANLDQDLVNRITRWLGMTTKGLSSVSKTGEVKQAEEQDEIANMLIPAALAMMIFFLVMMSTPMLMNNVLEEKMQRIAEVLVASVSPFQLLMGKLLAAVLVSLTLAILYVGATLVFVHNMDDIPPPVLEALGPGVLVWFCLFLVLCLLIYGAVFSALGAACSEIQDSQSLMGPAMVLLMFPIFFLGPVMKSPDGTLATALSFFPPATPIIMFMRMTMPPGVAWWELVLAVTACAAFTALAVLAASKVFRIGILSQGQAPSYRKLLGWIWSK